MKTKDQILSHRRTKKLTEKIRSKNRETFKEFASKVVCMYIFIILACYFMQIEETINDCTYHEFNLYEQKREMVIVLPLDATVTMEVGTRTRH